VDFPELQPIVNAFRYKERQLQQEAMKINWIIRHIPGGLLIVNNQQEILFAVCPPFEDLGIPLDDLVGQSLRVFEERIGVKREGSALMDALQKGIKSRRISKVRDRYFEAVSTPMVNAEGQIDGAVCLFVDVSERVHQEQEMKRLEKLRLVGQMAASLSHEIRNPLTVIRGYLQLYSKRPHHEPAQGQFQLLLGEIDRVSEIVQQFLGLTRDRGEDMQPRSLTEVVEQVAPLVNSEASFSGIKLQLCLEETPPIPLCDSDIKQLLLNLYRNAVEACQPGGHVQLTTGTDENGRPYLRVQDDGCGMPSHVLAHLGTPFQSTKENGTGLGLPLCLGIAQAHGAELSFDSAPDHGTIVTVLFPKPKHARRADASDN
jgi:signal transduction histidine kinase